MKTRIALLTLITAALSVADESHFGLVTVGGIDTARLTAVCDNDSSATPSPCDIQLEFHDIHGAILKQSSITLQPGAGGLLDFNSGSASPVEIAPCWTVLRGVAMASLEIFDIFSLRTRVLINYGDRPTLQTGDVDFGMVGVTRFDTLRLGVICSADGSVTPAPCDVTFNFSDAQGRTIKQSRVILAAGAGGSLDLKWSEIGTTASRVEISPCWTVATGGLVPLGAVVGSLAVLDNLTGLTIAQSYPAAPVSATQ